MDKSPSAHFSWSLVDGVAVIELQSRHIDDPQLAQELGAQLLAAHQMRESNRYLLSLRHTKYMSSTAFATLLEFWKQVTADGGQVKICGMDPDVRVGADIIGLGHCIPIYEDQRTALAAFQEEGRTQATS